jgi:copper resistance protein C
MGRVLTHPRASTRTAGRRVGRSVTTAVAVAGLAIGALTATAMPTSAHAQLVSVEPPDGSTAATPPTEVVLTFDERVSSSFAVVRVTSTAGVTVSQGPAKVDGTVVTEALVPHLPVDRYTVTFRVVSTDGHPVASVTTFTVTGGAQSPTSTSAAGPSSAATSGSTVAGPTGSATSIPATGSTSAMGTPTNILDPSHVPGFIAVGLLVLGALGILYWERLRRRS